jgi:glycosyltransferase involved in cell wall biosynthesis
MLIGIDGSCWTNRRGFGRFARGLVGEMLAREDREFVILIDEPSAAQVDVPGRVEIRTVPVREAPTDAASASGHRRLSDVLRMTRAAQACRCDAFFFPSTYTWFPVPGTRTVVTVHDAIAESQPDAIFSHRRSRALWTLKQKAALRSARQVVTVSQAAREDVERVLRVPSHRLTVINEAPDRSFRPTTAAARAGVLARYALDESVPYLLYVGGISPHKNLEVLVEAFGLVAVHHPTAELVIVGDTADDPFLSATGPVLAKVAASPARDRIRLTGFVPDEDLVALYGGAVALVQPSRGEGFGLTAAEAAACGTPVVASAIPALQELLGDAALYADPGRPEQFAAAFDRLLLDRAARDRLAQLGRERAAQWSWAAAADTTIAVLEAVARG